MDTDPNNPVEAMQLDDDRPIDFADLDVLLASTSQVRKTSVGTATTTAPPVNNKPPLSTQPLTVGSTSASVPAATTAKLFAKIAPKPLTAVTTAAPPSTTAQTSSGSGAAGQFVIFQSQNGKPQQIRLSATGAPVITAGTVSAANAGGAGGGSPAVALAAANSSSTMLVGPTPISGNIQLIKSSDGASFIQLKPANNVAVAAPASNVTAVTAVAAGPATPTAVATVASGGAATATATATKCVLVKSSAGQRLLLGPSANVTNLKLASPGQLQAAAAGPSRTAPRTMTVAQAQKMGLLTQEKLKELVTAAKAQKQAKQQQQQQQKPQQTAAANAASVSVPIATTASNVAAVAGVSTVVRTTPVSIAPKPSNVQQHQQQQSTTTIALGTPSTTSDAVNAAGATIASAPPSTVAAPSQPSTTTTAAAKAAATPPLNQKITIRTSDGFKKHVVLPPNLYKMAQQGQIKAVNIAGRGVQYLRLNTSGTSAPPLPAKVMVAPTTTAVAATTTAAASSDPTQTAIIGVRATTGVAAHASNGNPQPKMTTVKAKPVQAATTGLEDGVEGASAGSKATNNLVEVIDVQEPPKPKSTATAKPIAPTTTTTTATLLNRSLKMEETIDPDTLLRRSSLPANDGLNRRSIGGSSSLASGGNALNQSLGAASGSASSSSVVTYSFGSPRKYIKTEPRTNTVTDSVTATMVDSSSSFYNSQSSSKGTASESELDGPRRKHCNCTKSQCLKLYCDCFANGEFCKDCNCKDCFNNIDYEEERQKAIRICLERNPHAFKPKIGQGKDTSDSALRRHNKGCNCKRSGCLKNYCECYEAKIACSANCKCVDCHNMDEFVRLNASSGAADTSSSSLDHHHHHHGHSGNAASGSAASSRGQQQQLLMSEQQQLEQLHRQRSESPEIPAKKPCNFMTQDVIEATIQCVIAQAEECQKNNLDARMSEKLILEEFGRCLVEIIEFSLKN